MKEILEAFLGSDVDSITVTKRLKDGGVLTWSWERPFKRHRAGELYSIKTVASADEVIKAFGEAKALV